MTAFPSSLFTKTTVGASDPTNSPSHSGLHNNDQDEIIALETKVGIDNSTTDTTIDYFMRTGWLGCSETFVYGSADSPTFTMTVAGVDVTSKYPIGTKFWLTQTTSKYFIVTGITFSTNTTITLYGGTDYTLANAAITNPRFSRVKSPTGFPMDTTKWTVEVTDTSLQTQTSPTNNTWYNTGSLSITIPIGLWDVYYSVCLKADKTSATSLSDTFVALSTANNSGSDESLVASHGIGGASGTLSFAATMTKTKQLLLTSKTPYYLNLMNDGATLGHAYFDGRAGNGFKTVMRARSLYL